MKPESIVLDADAVLRLAGEHAANTGCAHCAIFRSAGWEAFPTTAEEAKLRRIGSLRARADEEPTLEEHHPEGTGYWSKDAPIALNFHPCNRSEVWACVACGKPFLRYTEYGGYYEERRIRELRAELISTAPLAG